jgi:hypothetical protein
VLVSRDYSHLANAEVDNLKTLQEIVAALEVAAAQGK